MVHYMNSKKAKLTAFLTVSALVLSTAEQTEIGAENSENKTLNAVLSMPRIELSTVNGKEILLTEMPYNAVTELHIVGDSGLFPTRYDLRETSGVTSVKNQSGHGTCWAHTASASAETDLLQSVPDIDLSELHTAFFAYYGNDQIEPKSNDVDGILEEGGNRDIAVNLWSQWIGPVYESRLPYSNTKILNDKAQTEELRYQSDFHLENAVMLDYDKEHSNFEEINALVKQLIMEGRAVDSTLYYNYSETFNSTYDTTNSRTHPRFANHAVTIIGWDDSISALNFKNSPKGNGAWLVKNSYGAGFGKDGYMWVSYYDRSFGEFTTYDLGDKENYQTIYQYDSFVPTQTLCAGDGTVINEPTYMADIFHADREEQIEAISTYFMSPETEYEITVYTGLTDGEITSGTASETTYGKAELTGYFTIELDKPVAVGADEDFSVVVKMTNAETPFVVPVETSLYAQNYQTDEIENISSYATYDRIMENSGDNESYISADGTEWESTTKSIMTYDGEEKEMLLESIKEQLYEGIEEDDTARLLSAEILCQYYDKLFETSEINLIIGNISMKVFSNPVNTPKFSHISGAVPLDERISLSIADTEYTLNGKDYQIYKSPIEIEKFSTLSTSERFGNRKRTYYPMRAEFFDLEYKTITGTSVSVLNSAERKMFNEYVINANDNTNSIKLFPITDSKVSINGKECQNYSLTDEIELKNGTNIIKLELKKENALDNTVTVIVYKGNPTEFETGDADGDGKIDASDASKVLTHYSLTSVGKTGEISEYMQKYADYNADGIIDATDASAILTYYAQSSVN